MKKAENLFKMGLNFITTSAFVINFDFILDIHSDWKQVNFLCNFPYQIRNFVLIFKYINEETCKTLVQVLVIFRLNYQNVMIVYTEYRTVQDPVLSIQVM